MGRVSEWVGKYGIGGLSAVAVVALLVVGVMAVGGSGGEQPSRAVLTLAADDDGTPDQGPGDAGSTTASIQPTTPTTGAPATTAVPSTAPASGTRTIPVAGVGVVVITEKPLGLVSSTPASGFTSSVESSTREVHVRFEDASGGRIDVQAEIEDDAVRVRVRDRRTGASTAGSTSGTTMPTQAVPVTTLPSVDDHGGHGADDSGFDDHGGDRSGNGGGDDHGGSSGHGGGDD